ncbi:MAG: hypothetical protein JOY66_08725 [Acetobacteraceae bacterium]|nr:hypothetical protein [Acetobacteraceae bacterium]
MSDSNQTPTVNSMTLFATAPDSASAPDSITTSKGSIWVEYGNTASSSGGGGNSTIVQYNTDGSIENTFTIAGEVDGLKIDPKTGVIWALQNQDGNSTLSFIYPPTGQVSPTPLQYGPPYVYGANSTRGFDDVAFIGKNVYESETNPVNPGDPVIVKIDNGTAPFGTITTTPILRLGDTGTNLVTGATDQPLPVTDPDSLKTLPDGSLILTGEQDDALTIVQHPGTPQQSASFIQWPSGQSPDDAIVPTSTSGTFYVASTGDNNVYKVQVSGLNPNDIYASDQQANEVVQVDPRTGQLTPLITGLNKPHGLLFVPSNGGGSGTYPSAALGSGSTLAPAWANAVST